MDIDRLLSIHQSHSLMKIGAINKQMLIAQYSQCEQISALQKEIAASNSLSRQILNNQLKDIKHKELLAYYKSLAYAMKEAAARDAESQLAITKQKIADEKQSYNMSKAQVDTETARSMELIQSKKQSVKMLTEKRDQLKRELEEETSVLNAQQDQITKLQMEIASAQITKPNRNQMQTPIQSKPPPTSSVRKDRCLELFEENAFGAY